MKMSVVGRKMTESITKKVIIAVILMLLSFSLLENNFTPDARQIQLNDIASYPTSEVLLDVFFDNHANVIGLVGHQDEFIDEDRLKELRNTEILVLASEDASITAMFDISEETREQAWYTMAMTILVATLLALLSWLFSRDAYRIMIRPIEQMKFTVQQLSENPLLHLERMKKNSNSDNNETDMLQQAITKMAKLLQVGFGCAGAEIIAKNLGEKGDLDPMVPGVRVNAIFGFCDIRDFTFATEGLQQDVMLFVNKVAEITHKHVTESGGAPNKNIGDAFLLVWKLNSSKNGGRSHLQKELFDAALISSQKTLSDIKETGSLASFLKEVTNENAPWKSSLEDFSVRMGFGLHMGWAIEGAIGSMVKVDASYLSPHVNLASRLEAATKYYRVPLLMSEAFVGGLTGAMQTTCRRCDRVTFKGSNEPMLIFHHDAVPVKTLARPEHYAELLSATTWKDEAELENADVKVEHFIDILKSENNLVVREVYEQAFNAYLDGRWDRCKILLHLWLEKFPGDVLAQVLVERLKKKNFQCPPEWSGVHAYTEK